MRLHFRALLASLSALVALVGASGALACGAGGYTYAGIEAPAHAYGIGAVITPLSAFNVMSGHVAGWVGVGGPKQGPNGSDEWLQVGFSGFPGLSGTSIYYELMLPSGAPTYHQVMTGLPLGRSARVAVLEMGGRPDYWRVWVNGAPASKPIRMPASHGRWSPIATAESWDGGTGGTCNSFLYRFHQVQIAHAPGGSWQQLVGGYPISSSSSRVARNAPKDSFLAAQGAEALRTLAASTP
jgi:hypothetical protein